MKRGRLALFGVILAAAVPDICQGLSVPLAAALSGRKALHRLSPLCMSSEVNDEDRHMAEERPMESDKQERSMSEQLQNLMSTIKNDASFSGKMPPFKVDDTSLLYFDVFLIINLVVSISFWVVHRMQVEFLGAAFNEACLMSVLWIGAGLYNGAFLHSAVDGHYKPGDERGGPKAAGMLGFHTYISAINLRLLFALIMAVLEHRPVGATAGEQLLPLEVGFGLIMMSFWRTVHSSYVPRV